MNASSNKSSPGLPGDDSQHPAIPPSAPASALYREKPSAPPAFAFPQAQPSPGNAAGELKPLRPPPGAYRRSVSMADVDKGKSYVLSARVTERQSSLKMSSSSVEVPTLRRLADVAGDTGNVARPEDVIWKNLIASAQVHNREISGLREVSCNANERVRSGNSACDSSEGLGSLSAKRKPVPVLEGLKEVEEEGNAPQVTPREEASREITPRPSTAQEVSREITPRPSTAATDVASTPTTDVPWTPTFERDGAMPPPTPQSAAEAAAQRAARKAAQGSCIPPRAQSPRRRNSGLFRKQGSGRLDGSQRQGSGRLDGPQRQGSGRGLAGLASAAAGAAAGAGAGAGRRSISRMSSVKKWRVLNALVKQMNVEDAENETADDGNGGGAGDSGGGGGFTATETHSGAIKSESDKSGWGAPSFSGMSVGGDTEGGGGGQTEEFSAPWSFGSMGDVERFNNTAGGGFADYSVAAASVCQVSPAIFEAHLHLAETMAREEMERQQQQQQQQQEGRHGKGPRTPRTPRTPRVGGRAPALLPCFPIPNLHTSSSLLQTPPNPPHPLPYTLFLFLPHSPPLVLAPSGYGLPQQLAQQLPPPAKEQ
ncbi:unnamed protein product [Closterium sp. Naga37s-1]|nr:unnamed protein product [Closterium sp. Naga37s-1]